MIETINNLESIFPLVGVLIGSVITGAGGWLAIKSQSKENKEARKEQYAREDKLRNLAERRELYAKFYKATDDTIKACYRLCMAEPENLENITAEEEARVRSLSMGEIEGMETLRFLISEIKLLARVETVAAAERVMETFHQRGTYTEPEASAEASEEFIKAARKEFMLESD